MKKILSLLPVVFLALTGCNNKGGEGEGEGGGGNSPGSELATALTTLKNAKEYKIKFNDLEETEAQKTDVMGMFEVTAKESFQTKGLGQKKGFNYYMDLSQAGGVERIEFGLTEAIAQMAEYGVTSPAAYVQMMNKMKAYADFDFDFGIDTEKDTAWVEMGLDFYAPNTAIELYYDEQEEQFKLARYEDGKIEYSEWINGPSTEVQMAEFDDLVEALESNGDKLEVKDGKYHLDLSDDPIEVDNTEINDITFSFAEGHYYITFIGYYEEYESTLYGDYDIYDLGNCGHEFTNFEVFCPFNHICAEYKECDEGHHILTCDYCHKHLEKTPHEHTYDEVHHICTECFEGYHGHDFYKDPDLLLENGYYALSAYVGENGLIYDGHINENECDEMFTPFEDQTKRYEVYYFAESELLLVEEEADFRNITPCIVEAKTNIHVYGSVKVELTPEQQEMIEHYPKYEINVYEEALNLPDTYAEFVTQFADKKLKDLVVYELDRHCDFKNGHEVNKPESCFYGYYSVCSVCGRYQSGGEFKHTCEYHIAHPEWGSQDTTYLELSVCSVCGKEDNHIYSCENATEYHEDYGAYYPAYSQDGTQMMSGGYFQVPHMDEDKDGHCDICGAVALTVEINNKKYIVYVYESSIVNSSAWEFMSEPYYDAEDEVYLHGYQYAENEEIVIYYGCVYDDETSEYHYYIYDGTEVLKYMVSDHEFNSEESFK